MVLLVVFDKILLGAVSRDEDHLEVLSSLSQLFVEGLKIDIRSTFNYRNQTDLEFWSERTAWRAPT